ncbi:MAG: energy-coupling factor ABC transporter ATP-binding protein [Planctomycetes bacterium]|nr:energy-coupling factor ABC transporter ATP-binding protein [Planctomycetota bacterium]
MTAPAAAATPPVFRLEEVAYTYPGEVNALSGLSLAIEEGDRVALLGATGSGKSTLLLLLDGLIFPAAGKVFTRGEPLTEARLQEEDDFRLRFRAECGLVFQNADHQLFNSTVEEELAFGPLQLGWAETRVRAAVATALADFRLERLRQRPPFRLSGGEKRRVALASVLIAEPRVLLLDEPSGGLDPRSIEETLTALGATDATPAAARRTLVFATHDLHMAAALARRVVLLSEDGRVAADGPAERLLADESLLATHNLLHRHAHQHAERWHAHPHRHGAEPGQGAADGRAC